MPHRIFEGANGYYIATEQADGTHRQPSDNGASLGWDYDAAERELASLSPPRKQRTTLYRTHGGLGAVSHGDGEVQS